MTYTPLFLLGGTSLPNCFRIAWSDIDDHSETYAYVALYEM